MSDFKDDIEKYRKGELTSAEMHALEKRALSDSFLADALEGAESISSQDFSFDLYQIDKKLLSKRKKTSWFTPLRIAAGFILMIGSAILFYTFNQPEQQLALQKEEVSTGNSADSLVKEEPELLSLNQPKEETKIKKEVDPKTKASPTLAKADEGGEAKTTAGISSSQTAPIVAEEPARTDQAGTEELSEITLEEEKAEEREKIAVAPVQQSLRKEVVEKDMVSRSNAKKSAAADDQPTQRRVVKGQVTSSEDGLPLPGVHVTVKGTTFGTVTNMQGNYSIPVENEKQQLVFSFFGLQTSEISPANKSTVDVKLLEDVSQLSEVVVMGQGLKSDRDASETPVIKLAEPFGGKKAYDKYLENNLRYPQQALESKVKGKVTINFIVGMDGTLRDFNVIRSLGFGCDDEVIRLVKEGPKWYPSSENNVGIESTVRVKMKFDPAKVKK